MGAPLVWSDAWLLLALIYSGEPADQDRIIAVGDSINHAIFTDDELDGGLRRLLAAGHAVERDGKFGPAPSVLGWYEKAGPKRRCLHKDLDRVEEFLRLNGAA